MKVFLRIGVLTGFLIGSLSPSVFAESKSASFRVSCFIPATIQVSVAKASGPSTPSASTAAQRPELGFVSDGAQVSVKTNLGKQYQFEESYQKRPEGRVKIFSVTAL